MNKGQKKRLGDDWQTNWGTSIAIKTTAPVLWILIFVGLAIAIIVQQKFVDNLETILVDDADRLSYLAEKYLIDIEGGQPLEIENILNAALAETEYLHGEIQIKSRKIKFGIIEKNGNKNISVNKKAYYFDSSYDPEILTAELVLYHPPLETIINQHRKDFLIMVGFPLLIFGLFLGWFIHLIVTKPIFELVKATKAVSEGDMSLRLETTRKDEFGHLSEFFNEMLDNVQAKQKALTKAVDDAESANKMKSSFLANMSHEIRTPLTAIIGYSDLLKSEDYSKQEQNELLDSICRSSNHLQEIINDILDLSKIEAGQLQMELIQFSPVELLKEVEDIISTRAKNEGLGFSTKYKFPFPKHIYSDPTRLRQILLNLASNSVKFTSKGNICIKLSYQKDSQQLSFDVTDTGIGMTETESERLFVPFMQGDSSTTREYGGTGLGLCISQQLAGKLGGEITCVSRKNIGSKFTFSMNLAGVNEKDLITKFEAESIKNKTDESYNFDTRLEGKVLLVEDTPDNQILISMYLNKVGIEVDIADNGQIAVNKALGNEYDLILMDIQMPVMDGVEATRVLRENAYNKPIVIITANVLKEDKDNCIAVGVDGYLTKPLDLPEFYGVLKHYLLKKNVSKSESFFTDDYEESDYLSSQQSTQQKTSPVSTVGSGLDSIQSDPEFIALRNNFIDGLPNHVSKINSELKNENWDDLRIIVHNLKGMGASYGLGKITEIANIIQNQITAKEYDKVHQHIPELIGQCQNAVNRSADTSKAS